MDNLLVGRRIREAREKQSLSREQLAEKANIGAFYLGEIERGEKIPSLTVFISIVEALGVSSDSLLCDEISVARAYVHNDFTEKLDKLSPQQRVAVLQVLEAFMQCLHNPA